MTLTCAKCNSMKVAPNVRVMDQGQYSDGSMKVLVEEVPEAMIFKGRKMTHLRANICGECGFTELYAEDPELIYEAYRKSQEPRKYAVSLTERRIGPPSQRSILN